MSYIKIHEVDKTIQDLAPITSDNIAYIPLNSTDGPIGRYTVLQSYDDFVRVYGSDPNPDSPLLTSWEYAANLLLRKMPVMVRRIGYEIDKDGNDTTKLLTGAAAARGILKLEVPDTAETIYRKSLDASVSGVSDPLVITLKSDGGATTQSEADKIELSYRASSKPQEFSVTCHDSQSDTRKTNVYSITEDLLSDTPSKVVITPNDQIDSIRISDCSVCGSYILFGSQDNNFKVSLNNCEVTDSTGNALTADNIKALEAEAGMTVIPRGYKLTFTELTERDFELTLIGDADIKIYKSATSPDYRLITFYSDLTSVPYVVDVDLPDSVAIEDPDQMTEFDAKGLLNLFKLEYKHPGVNGNRISAGVRLVDRDGIYLQIWNGTQRLENIKLVNMRYKDAETGRYADYTLNADKNIVWKAFLDNFGLIKTDGTISEVSQQTPLETDYITVSLNTNIDTANADYVLCFLNKTGVTRYSLTGGSNPDDSCVIHEVYKTYSRLSDKYLYDVKFVTNGGYCDYIKEGSEGASTELIRRNIEYSMINLAESRGDCVAFLDVPLEYPEKDVLDYFEDISSSYATAYAPWTKLNLLTRSTKWCPPSFVALWTIAKSVSRGNKVYAPPAGVNRAHVSEATDLMFQIPSDYIDEWQDNHVQFVNPIVYINGYGINIFGQRTLYSRVDGSYETSSALQYLNTRLVANEIKKKIFKSCIELTFEYNNLHTWLAFKSKMAKLLDVLLYDHSITYYDIVMDESTMSDYDIQTNHIVGTVSVAISTTAEKFDITFELLPNQVNFLNLDYSVDDSTASTTYGQLKTN